MFSKGISIYDQEDKGFCPEIFFTVELLEKVDKMNILSKLKTSSSESTKNASLRKKLYYHWLNQDKYLTVITHLVTVTRTKRILSTFNLNSNFYEHQRILLSI